MKTQSAETGPQQSNGDSPSRAAHGSAFTRADYEALKRLPEGWFSLRQVPWQIQNPNFRCRRLADKGALESRVVGEIPDIETQWRKTPNAESSHAGPVTPGLG